MKLGVIGLGFMGSTHLSAWKNIPGVELAAVSSANPQALTGDLTFIEGNLGNKGEIHDFSNVAKYADAFEAARDPQAEIVDICLPTDMHVPVAIEALRAGKHVIVEKPMGLDGAECDRLLAAAASSGKILMAAQVLRFIPDYRLTREAIQSGQYGEVRSAFFRRRCAAPVWGTWHKDASKSGGGVFDLLIHDVDYIVQLLGAPESLTATGYEKMDEGIDVIHAEFTYPGIGGVIVSGGWHHPKAYPFSMEFTVVTDGATFEYSSAGRPLTRYTAGGEAEPVETAEVNLFQLELEYFLDCVKRGEQPALCLPSESAAAVKLARLMLESRAKNGERIACKV